MGLETVQHLREIDAMVEVPHPACCNLPHPVALNQRIATVGQPISATILVPGRHKRRKCRRLVSKRAIRHMSALPMFTT